MSIELTDTKFIGLYLLYTLDTYTLALPANLPPTYRGRVMKFAYHLVVGVCRSAPNPQGPSGGSTSQVMRVPVRIYNHVDGM